MRVSALVVTVVMAKPHNLLSGLVGYIADDLGYAVVVEPDWNAAGFEINRHAVAGNQSQRMIDLELVVAESSTVKGWDRLPLPQRGQ